ncbi:hypothetical protein ACK3BK_09175 [Pseudomonas sp. L7]|uniref:hypothetical protein n=1 Tax=Pseudomonas sp. L7 TaxID=3388343 RepID=UPI003984AB28
MSAFQKKNPLHFKTQYGLGFDPQDDQIVVDFFCGGGGAGTRYQAARQFEILATIQLHNREAAY